jgi:RNA polymerase sigma factor (sigma-70 family)
VNSSEKWDKLPDAELAARVRAGDTAAFDDIVKCYSPVMLGFFLNELGFDQFVQAEDLTSETMTAAWTTLRSGRSALPENFKAWLFGIARHILSRYLKEKITRGEILTFEPEAYEFGDQKALDNFREVEYKQGLPRFLELVDSAVESMPAKYRNVIRINMRDGKTGKALAAQVGVTSAEASRLLNEARPKLVDAVATLLMARTCREACPKFDSYLQTARWTGGPFSDGLRRRLMQHISGCRTCKSARTRDKWIVFLPGLAPVLVAPELHQRIANAAFVTKDMSPPSSLASDHRLDGGTSPPETPSAPLRHAYAGSTGARGSSMNASGGSSEVTDPPANTIGDDGDARDSNSSRFRTGIVSSIALLLLAILGIFSYSINQTTQGIADRPASAIDRPASALQAGPLAVKGATTPSAEGNSDTGPPIDRGNPGASTPVRGNSDTSNPPAGDSAKPVPRCPLDNQRIANGGCKPDRLIVCNALMGFRATMHRRLLPSRATPLLPSEAAPLLPSRAAPLLPSRTAPLQMTRVPRGN